MINSNQGKALIIIYRDRNLITHLTVLIIIILTFVPVNVIICHMPIGKSKSLSYTVSCTCIGKWNSF